MKSIRSEYIRLRLGEFVIEIKAVKGLCITPSLPPVVVVMRHEQNASRGRAVPLAYVRLP
jgi:hypothetical protein